ncbi:MULTISPECIES: UPF0146 family protein [Halorubrum]|uniref:Uncharacterized protein n=1 Tax=Halorubrum hochstenium ATCC 700873 TaxID=1227481 RepID=M0FIN7_9EURY|nr:MULTISPECIES: UPF0146 family protein [Halorubrum]ELZ59127.1 hypothetical protein C467_04266 [Halorubrum hochstenium ATCC 700873]
MGPPPPSERALVDALDRYERLIEVGVGRRPGVAIALADRGREVVAVDVAVSDAARDAASETWEAGGGSLRVVAADVTALATDDDRAVGRALGLDADECGDGADASDATRVDAVYARNLPAELQSPTVALAGLLDADCLFTTLGFEEPVVEVRRRSAGSGTVVYVAR